MGKITRKISLLIAICMIVTVGGVYAQWTYHNSNATAKTATGSIDIQLQASNNLFEDSKGEFEVLVNNITLEIQDNYNAQSSFVGTDAGDYVAELHYSGMIVFIYNLYGDVTTLPDFIKLKHTIEENATPKLSYNGKDVFIIQDSGELVTSTGKITQDNLDELNARFSPYNARELTYEDLNAYYFIIDGTALSKHIMFNQVITLESISEYQNFQGVISAAKFIFTISDEILETSNTVAATPAADPAEGSTNETSADTSVSTDPTQG